MSPPKVSAGAGSPPPTAVPVQSLPDRSSEVADLLKKTGSDEAAFLDYFKVSAVAQLSPADQDKAIRLLQEKIRSAPKG